MGFKFGKGVPEGMLVPMYLSKDGRLYSLRFKDRDQMEAASEVLAMMLSSLVGKPLVLDAEPLNDGVTEAFLIKDYREKKN